MLHVILADTTTTQVNGGAVAAIAIISVLFAVIFIAALWRVFSKAGQPGWAAIIPIYNTIVMLRVAGRPWWWFLLLLIPLVNIIVYLIVANDLSKAFGHGIGFTLGLIFLSPIFFLILGFGGSQYVGAQNQ